MTNEQAEKKHCAAVADEFCRGVREHQADWADWADLLMREREAVRHERKEEFRLMVNKRNGALSQRDDLQAEVERLRVVVDMEHAEGQQTYETLQALQAESVNLKDSEAAGWAIAKSRLEGLRVLQSKHKALVAAARAARDVLEKLSWSDSVVYCELDDALKDEP